MPAAFSKATFADRNNFFFQPPPSMFYNENLSLPSCIVRISVSLRRNSTMAEPTIETLLRVLRDEMTHLRAKAIAINLVSADLLKRGYYVYRQEMPDELYHLLAIKDDDPAISRIRVLTHPMVHGMDDLFRARSSRCNHVNGNLHRA
jgi:hypothetical protein